MADENNVDMQVTDPEDGGISFTILDDDGNEVECQVLYLFHTDYNDKHYMVYTTGVVTDEGEEISAVRYDPEALDAMVRGEDVDVTLEPLTEDIEWALVADTLKQFAPDVPVDDSEVAVEGVQLERAPEN